MTEYQLKKDIKIAIKAHLENCQELGYDATHEFTLNRLSEYVIALAPHIVQQLQRESFTYEDL